MTIRRTRVFALRMLHADKGTLVLSVLLLVECCRPLPRCRDPCGGSSRKPAITAQRVPALCAGRMKHCGSSWQTARHGCSSCCRCSSSSRHSCCVFAWHLNLGADNASVAAASVLRMFASLFGGGVAS